jgi:hypothetical protein
MTHAQKSLSYPDGETVELFDKVVVAIDGHEHAGIIKAIYPRARTAKVFYDTHERARTSTKNKWGTWNFPISQINLVLRDG